MNTRLVILILAVSMFLSCKKEDALSKVDPNATEVEQTAEAVPNPEPNIGPPPLPETTTAPPADGKYPVMNFAKKEHDFGTINEGQKVVYTFNFENTGESDLIISNAVGSCGCTVPEFPKDPIKPGASGKMKVSFNSDGKPGNQQKTVTITANTQTGKETLTIKASVTPKA